MPNSPQPLQQCVQMPNSPQPLQQRVQMPNSPQQLPNRVQTQNHQQFQNTPVSNNFQQSYPLDYLTPVQFTTAELASLLQYSYITGNGADLLAQSPSNNINNCGFIVTPPSPMMQPRQTFQGVVPNSPPPPYHPPENPAGSIDLDPNNREHVGNFVVARLGGRWYPSASLEHPV
jgi:hypothetical protein